MNESIRQQIMYEVLKSLCASATSLEYTARALVDRAEQITDELSTRTRGTHAS